MLEVNKIYNMDCLEGLKQIDDNSVDSIVTDPPYELGFMGKKWDATGIAYNIELWKECLRVLKPGGYLLSFGGTRTYHRMTVAIEDAGFEIRDMIEWVYGTGFPKGLNVGKQIDKLQGNEREVVGKKIHSHKGVKVAEERSVIGAGAFGEKREGDITKGTSEWEGWGTALKPAHEPIVMARKPLEGGVAENVIKHGTGAINIDGCRIETEDKTQRVNKGVEWGVRYDKSGNDPKDYGSALGRFPANLIHDGSEEVEEFFPDTAPSKSGTRRNRERNSDSAWVDALPQIDLEGGFDDSGTASRFFKSIKSIIYAPKASKSEREGGCDDLEEKPVAWSNQAKAELERGNIDFDRNDGRKHNKVDISKNTHPTVKPLELMKYLVRMVTRVDGLTIDPFVGSGTTAVACSEVGVKYIGFEKDTDYAKIAQARIKEAESQTRLFPFGSGS